MNIKSYNKIFFIILIVFLFQFGFDKFFVSASSNRLSGKILLQVERNGEAWYVNPVDDKRYYLGRPADAFNIMRELGLGISEKIYNSIVAKNYYAPSNLAGRILLRVEANGEAYYVNPDNNKLSYLGRPVDAFRVMRDQGLGISDKDLDKIDIEKDMEQENIDNSGNSEMVCQDECVPYYTGTCIDNNAHTCEDFDNDGCLEWGVRECADNQICAEVYDERATRAYCYTEVPCHDNNYSMAFILLEIDSDKAKSVEIERINRIKSDFAERFYGESDKLASMDTSYPVQVIEMKKNPSYSEVAQEFYKSNPDNFDFLTIYTTYDSSSGMGHAISQSNILGIHGPIEDGTKSDGSGRLLGISWMRNIDIDMLEWTDWEYIGSVNGVLHETLHQWGAGLDFIDSSGKRSKELRGGKGYIHWSNKLNIGYSAIGGREWIDNKDGTFTVAQSTHPTGHTVGIISKLDKYTMGLIPADELGQIEIFVPDNGQETAYPGDIIAGHMETITIDQIIAAEGRRACVDFDDIYWIMEAGLKYEWY